jgi:hypothetical protein
MRAEWVSEAHRPGALHGARASPCSCLLLSCRSASSRSLSSHSDAATRFRSPMQQPEDGRRSRRMPRCWRKVDRELASPTSGRHRVITVCWILVAFSKFEVCRIDLRHRARGWSKLRRLPCRRWRSCHNLSTGLNIRGFNTQGDVPAVKLLIDGIPSNFHAGTSELEAYFHSRSTTSRSSRAPTILARA